MESATGNYKNDSYLSKEVTMTVEQRKHERKKITTIVQYKKGLFSGRKHTVTKDMSVGGLCFFSEEKIRLGKVIKMRIFQDKKTPDQIVKGRVVWSREYNDSLTKGYLNGLSFLHY